MLESEVSERVRLVRLGIGVDVWDRIMVSWVRVTVKWIRNKIYVKNKG